MKAAKRNLIIDICAGFFCGVVIITGFLQWIFYPHQGSGPGGGFILSHAQLYNLHFAVSMIALCFIVIHLLLHQKWIRHCARTPGKKSRHLKINIGADVAGTVCGVVSLISGLVLWIVYPLGISGKGHIFFLGQPYAWWYDIHFFSAVLFTIFLAVHLILHWNWIKNSGRVLSC